MTRPWGTRFEDNYIPEPNSGCWLWMQSINKRGYGIFFRDGFSTAHRYSWYKSYGHPRGNCVLHKCDVRSCVNPDHLFIGTRADNNTDKTIKGRQIKGEQIKSSKLTEQQVLSIRADERENIVIAADYGVDTSAIWRIKNRKRWKWLCPQTF